jgi:hypothetical protein
MNLPKTPKIPWLNGFLVSFVWSLVFKTVFGNSASTPGSSLFCKYFLKVEKKTFSSFMDIQTIMIFRYLPGILLLAPNFWWPFLNLFDSKSSFEKKLKTKEPTNSFRVSQLRYFQYFQKIYCTVIVINSRIFMNESRSLILL